MDEIWKDIPGFEYYQASSLGRIKSKDRYSEYVNKNGTMCRRWKKGRIMKLGYDKDGYQQIQLYSKDHKYSYFSVHRVIATTFLPNPDNLPQVDHINGIKDDNRV